VYPSTESIIALALLGVIGLCIAYSFVAVPQVIGISLILTPVAGLLLYHLCLVGRKRLSGGA
jgi:hypothetical protein